MNADDRRISAALALVLMIVTACGLASAPATADATSASMLTVKVPLPPATRATPGSPLVLHLEDLKLPPGSSGHVRVYANLPADAEAKLRATPTAEPDPADPHYLGSFNIVPRNSAEAAKGIERQQVTLDVSQKASTLATKSEVTLTFVAPRTPTRESPESPSPSPRIGKVYFTAQ